MLDVGGQDATEAFEDVGHSDEAREILEGLLIGTLKRGVCFHSSSIILKPHLKHILFFPLPMFPSPSPSLSLPFLSRSSFLRLRLPLPPSLTSHAK